MTFEEALQKTKEGKAVKRAGWTDTLRLDEGALRWNQDAAFTANISGVDIVAEDWIVATNTQQDNAKLSENLEAANALISTLVKGATLSKSLQEQYANYAKQYLA